MTSQSGPSRCGTGRHGHDADDTHDQGGGIAALLLAAGESTRMGQLKALLPWQGTTLIEHQITALASAGVSRTIVVLGHQRERLESLLEGYNQVQCVYNPDYKQGKTTSIKAGVGAFHRSQDSASPDGAILILNVDQPRSADTIRRIMALHSQGGGGPEGLPRLITIPTYGGKGGHPVVLSGILAPELMDISEETLGLKAVTVRHEKATRRVEIDAPEILLDLNTPEDYRKALGQVR